MENARLATEIKKVEEQNEKELELAEEEYEEMTKEFGEKFKDQSNLQTEVISIIKEQYDKIQELYRVKSINLVNAIEKGKGKLGKTEQRRRLELEGYYEDLRLLEKKVSFYENYTNKLKNLVEQDARKMLKKLWEENDKLAEGN